MGFGNRGEGVRDTRHQTQSSSYVKDPLQEGARGRPNGDKREEASQLITKISAISLKYESPYIRSKRFHR